MKDGWHHFLLGFSSVVVPSSGFCISFMVDPAFFQVISTLGCSLIWVLLPIIGCYQFSPQHPEILQQSEVKIYLFLLPL